MGFNCISIGCEKLFVYKGKTSLPCLQSFLYFKIYLYNLAFIYALSNTLFKNKLLSQVSSPLIIQKSA